MVEWSKSKRTSPVRSLQPAFILFIKSTCSAPPTIGLNQIVIVSLIALTALVTFDIFTTASSTDCRCLPTVARCYTHSLACKRASKTWQLIPLRGFQRAKIDTHPRVGAWRTPARARAHSAGRSSWSFAASARGSNRIMFSPKLVGFLTVK
jgi:hypothetical protein